MPYGIGEVSLPGQKSLPVQSFDQVFKGPSQAQLHVSAMQQGLIADRYIVAGDSYGLVFLTTNANQIHATGGIEQLGGRVQASFTSDSRNISRGREMVQKRPTCGQAWQREQTELHQARQSMMLRRANRVEIAEIGAAATFSTFSMKRIVNVSGLSLLTSHARLTRSHDSGSEFGVPRSPNASARAKALNPISLLRQALLLLLENFCKAPAD